MFRHRTNSCSCHSPLFLFASSLIPIVLGKALPYGLPTTIEVDAPSPIIDARGSVDSTQYLILGARFAEPKPETASASGVPYAFGVGVSGTNEGALPVEYASRNFWKATTPKTKGSLYCSDPDVLASVVHAVPGGRLEQGFTVEVQLK